MFAVLELTLSCPVVVVRLLEYDMVRVVAFFFFSVLRLIVKFMLAK